MDQGLGVWIWALGERKEKKGSKEMREKRQEFRKELGMEMG